MRVTRGLGVSTFKTDLTKVGLVFSISKKKIVELREKEDDSLT